MRKKLQRCGGNSGLFVVNYCICNFSFTSHDGIYIATDCDFKIMEEFIQHKDLLLTKHEFAGGDAPTPKVNKARHKLVKDGKAKIVVDTTNK